MNKRGRPDSSPGFDDRREALVDILPNIRRFALSLAGNRADADDLLQATAERLLTRDAPAGNLLPWGLTVCRNLWIDEVRYRRVRQPGGEGSPPTDDTAVPGERQAIGELALRDTMEAVMELPEEQRAVLVLVAVEGCSYKEAAEILDIPAGTVMSRLARARAALIDRVGI